MQEKLPAYRTETVIVKDGTLTLENLPFVAGEAVEVIVLSHKVPVSQERRYPLRGLPLRYDCPTDAVALDDWDASN